MDYTKVSLIMVAVALISTMIYLLFFATFDKVPPVVQILTGRLTESDEIIESDESDTQEPLPRRPDVCCGGYIQDNCCGIYDEIDESDEMELGYCGPECKGVCGCK